MYGCESWTLKKAEWRRIDAFELWCWRRLLRVPWTARRSNQTILKEASPEYSLEGLMLKLKLQYFGHLMWRTDSWERPWCWERLKTGGERDDRGWDGWMVSPTQSTWVWVNSRSWWWTGMPGVLQSTGSQIVRHDWATELTNPKGSQLWIVTGRTDIETEAPVLWLPDEKRPWCRERLKARGEGDDRGWQRMRRLDGITDSTWHWADLGR